MKIDTLNEELKKIKDDAIVSNRQKNDEKIDTKIIETE